MSWVWMNLSLRRANLNGRRKNKIGGKLLANWYLDNVTCNWRLRLLLLESRDDLRRVALASLVSLRLLHIRQVEHLVQVHRGRGGITCRGGRINLLGRDVEAVEIGQSQGGGVGTAAK